MPKTDDSTVLAPIWQILAGFSLFFLSLGIGAIGVFGLIDGSVTGGGKSSRVHIYTREDSPGMFWMNIVFYFAITAVLTPVALKMVRTGFAERRMRRAKSGDAKKS